MRPSADERICDIFAAARPAEPHRRLRGLAGGRAIGGALCRRRLGRHGVGPRARPATSARPSDRARRGQWALGWCLDSSAAVVCRLWSRHHSLAATPAGTRGRLPGVLGMHCHGGVDPSARNSSSTSAPLRARVPPGSARRTTLGELRPMTWLVRATSSWFTTPSHGAAVGSIYPARRLGSPHCWRLRTPSGSGKESRQPRTSGLMASGYTRTRWQRPPVRWAKRSAVRC